MADDRGSASHILPDGTFVNLPKPTQRERANFFARSIANYKLISARQDNDNGVKVEGEEEGGGGGIAGKKENENGDREQKGADYVHPLAVASARLQGVGVAELSKAVNLSSLVGTNSSHDEGCYFTLANVIDDDAAALAAAATHRREMDVRKNSGDDKDSAAISDSKKDEVSANAGNNDGGAANFSNKTVEDATRKLKQDRKLRAQYLLKRKRLSYAKTISANDKKIHPWSAADVLELHAKRLKSQLKRQRVVDRRLLDLRKKWKLSLPDHGTRVVAPARPQEIVAVDLKVYSSLTQHDSLDVTPSNVYLLRHEQELQRRQQQANSIEATTAMNKMVPYYATIELDDEIDAAAVEALLLSRKNCKNQADNMGSNSVQSVDALDQKRKKDISKATRAEPLYTSSQISSRAISSNEDITTSQQLTLLVCIEKESTGFSKSVRLLTEKLDDDDMSIVSLQHSLFCSSLFDCIRTEIARESKVTEHDTILSASKLSTKTAISWLPNNMEESFLPPPSMMAANGSFCVIHSQEGEIKVRLNSEYSLIFKLIEIGAAMEFCAKESEGKNVDR